MCGDLDGAISKLSELLEQDLEISQSMSDNDLYEQCMNDKKTDRFGIERVPFAEKSDNEQVSEEMRYQSHSSSENTATVECRMGEEVGHAKKNSYPSGIKHCSSMKEIVEELSKIVEMSNKKEKIPFNMRDSSDSDQK